MKATLLVVLAMAATFVGGDDGKKPTFKPEEGYVPTKEVAIRIAVAVWGPIYGEANIAGEKPYRATLAEGVWTVEGSLPAGMKGGVAVAEIAKDDGKILRVSHGK